MSRTLDESDDDLNLQPRSRRADPREEISREMSHDAEREFTLSTGTVLALFFGLALVCAVFFGFGYSIGHKSAVQSSEVTSAAAVEPAAQPEAAANKPSAASPALPPIPAYQADPSATGKAAVAVPATRTTTSADGTRITIAAADTPAKPPRNEVSKAEVSKAAEVPAAPVVRVPAAPTPAATAATDPAAVYVQIAAVSHQEDANVLLSALKRRGYSVFTRSSEGDKLIHVQVGPYSGKKDAEVMRQRLLGDGYNAILK